MLEQLRSIHYGLSLMLKCAAGGPAPIVPMRATSTTLVSAEDLKLDDANGLKLLSIKLRKGATIAFHLPDDVFRKLKELVGDN